MIMAAQNQALRTNSIKRTIYKENVSAKGRMCGEGDKTVSHNVLEVVSWCRLATSWCTLVQFSADWSSLVQVAAVRYILVRVGADWRRLVPY